MSRIPFAGAALVLAAASWLTAPGPRAVILVPAGTATPTPGCPEFGLHAAQDALRIPGPADIEAALWRAIDGERLTAGLRALRHSPELAAAARDHSRTMAAGSILSHASPDGRSPAMRLVLAGIFFAANGENVARARSFNARLFHQSLMASPEHRANILNPEFDTVGIGVAGTWPGTIYVTQDFVRSLAVMPDVVATERIKRETNARRAEAALPPLVFAPGDDEFALRLCVNERVGGPRPPFPDRLGETRALLYSGPDPLRDAVSSPEVMDAELTYAGASVVFSRTASRPGGTYFSALLLASEIRYDKSDIALAKAVLDGLNSRRLERGLGPLVMNESASEGARRAIARARRFRVPWPGLTDVPSGNAVLSYSTYRPDTVPEGLLDRLLQRELLSVGIGATFVKSPDYPRGILRVIIVLPAGYR